MKSNGNSLTDTCRRVVWWCATVGSVGVRCRCDNSIASPHLGVANHQSPVNQLLSHVIGHTGQQMALQDEARVLHAIAQPHSPQARALAAFAQRVVYANVDFGE